MYLNYLDENEKIAFLKLAYLVAQADGEICENEKTIIGSYLNEMAINDISSKLTNETITSLSEEFKSIKSRKITILELMSVIYANGVFKETEKVIIDDLIKNFKLTNKFLDDVENWSKSLLLLIDHGTNLILGEEYE